MWPKSETPTAGRREQVTRTRRRPVMPLALKHSWPGSGGKGGWAAGSGSPPATSARPSPLTRTQRPHTQRPRAPVQAGASCPGAHLVLGEAEPRHPLSHLRGAPGQDGAGEPRRSCAIGLGLRPPGRPRPRGPRTRLHRRRPWGRHGNASCRAPVPTPNDTSWRCTALSFPPPPPCSPPTKPPAQRLGALRN